MLDAPAMVTTSLSRSQATHSWYSCVNCVPRFPASALTQLMTLAMRLVAPGMSAAAGTTSFETSGILPAIGFNGLSPRFALAPGPVIAPLMTTPLPMTKAAELTIPDIAPSGKVFYQGSPDCAESSAPGKTKMSIAEDLQAETHYSLKEVNPDYAPHLRFW